MIDVWEERKQELLMMLKNKPVLGLDVFIENTQKDCEGREWIDIGKKRIWIRRCPCGKVRLFQYFSTYKSRKNLCFKCAMVKKNQSDEMRKSVSESKLGEKNHFYGLKGSLNPACKPENREKISKSLKGVNTWSKGNQRSKGHKHTIETRRLISKTHKGKILSDEHKNKIKQSKRRLKVKEILERSKNGYINNIGKHETEYFKNLEKENGWNGIFYGKYNQQYIIENLGYFVDYYEPNKNIVVEYDEPYHYDVEENLKLKDQQRMNEIKNLLDCKFLRYNQRAHTLKEY